MQIRNHVFLITGGASGLGAATARLLVSEGGSVVLADTNRTTGEALAAELGPSARFALTDVTSEPDAQAAVDLTSAPLATSTRSSTAPESPPPSASLAAKALTALRPLQKPSASTSSARST